MLTIDLLEKGRNVLVVKWQPAAQHDVENYSTAPNINLWSSIEPDKEANE